MTTHHLNLATEPFIAIANGTKTIESRLYDEKRQKIRVGDALIFTNRDIPEQIIAAQVISLYKHPTFHDLFTSRGPTKFGGESIKRLEQQIGEFYTTKEQSKNGVLGIEFELIEISSIGT